jgi:P27 family predicted phage terminase small subunit
MTKPIVQFGAKQRIPGPPASLSPAMRSFWRAVTRAFELDPQHFKILQIACEAWDVAAQATATLLVENNYFTDKHGIRKAHPAINVRTQANKQFIASMRELGLDTPSEAPREPHLPRYQPISRDREQKVV